MQFSEMLSAADEHWLTGASGHRYTSEFRIVAVDQQGASTLSLGSLWLMLSHVREYPASPGHVHPTLGIAAELTRRGHRTSYAVTERLKEAVAETGARPALYNLAPASH